VLSGQSDHSLSGRGFFGAYPHAVVPGQYTVEGGQVSTVSVLKWYRDNFCSDLVAEAERRGVSAYDLLNEQAAKLPPGSEGLIVLDYWQGNRTPYVDPEARGVVWGLSLHHGRAHIYRAIQEGICYGTAHILRAMSAAGFDVRQFVACGGGTKSRAWMQMNADTTGVLITLTEVPDAAVLGSAVLAAVGAGVFPSIQEAAGAMVRETDTIEPDKDRHETYQSYVDAYAETYPRLQDLVRGMTRKVGQEQSAQKVTPRLGEMVSPLAAVRDREEA
jgi:ribulose kinase